jgi:hypothetical protein
MKYSSYYDSTFIYINITIIHIRFKMNRDILDKFKKEMEKRNINYFIALLVSVDNRLAYGHFEKRSQ